jgi:hypothetical protein
MGQMSKKHHIESDVTDVKEVTIVKKNGAGPLPARHHLQACSEKN